MENKNHWDNVFATKNSTEVSWTDVNALTIIDLINKIKLPKSAAIIDVGGGESFLAEALLKLGYKNIYVLDISEIAIKKAKQRLGVKANLIQWIVADITDFKTDIKFDFWNDRAVFHFFTNEKDIQKYVSTIESLLNNNGYFSLSTFSETGPQLCSGLKVKQYTEFEMVNLFKNKFEVIKCFKENHITPFNTTQNFQYCTFKFNK